MNVRLVQLDGQHPNLALMKLAHWHRSQGHFVHLTRRIYPDLFEADTHYDRVYASAIFDFSDAAIFKFRQQWPEGILGGTGTGNPVTVEQLVGSEYEHYDYTGYPKFTASIGFTQRGCRMSKSRICQQFCVVPKKEGEPRPLNTIGQIWRGEPWPKKLLLLDNDFFGNPQWRDRIREIQQGKFRVCFSQGINVRLMNEEVAQALASVRYRDTKFREKRLYTAWDNFGEERVFFNGVEKLQRAGIPPHHLMAYMLIGCDATETWERIWYRFRRMVDCGIEPYPMVYRRSRQDLLCFQRWVIRGLYRVPWPEYKRSTKTEQSLVGWNAVYGSAPSSHQAAS
jgi:hypothetical protein